MYYKYNFCDRTLKVTLLSTQIHCAWNKKINKCAIIYFKYRFIDGFILIQLVVLARITAILIT